MSRNWGKNSEYSTTVIYILSLGGSVIALLAVLGIVHVLEWMGR